MIYKRREIIGGCTLYLADCLDILPTIGRVGAVVTDPPYGIALKSHANGSHANRPKRDYSISGDKSPELGQTVVDWCLSNADSVIAFADPTLPWNGRWRSLLVWNKGGGVGGGGDTKTTWKQTWELIHVWNKAALSGGRDEAVLTFKMSPTMFSIHPAVKPIPLLSYLIGKIEPAGFVLDPFMGSGSTGVACAERGLQFIGIEIDERHFETACSRITEAYRQVDMFVPVVPIAPVLSQIDIFGGDK